MNCRLTLGSGIVLFVIGCSGGSGNPDAGTDSGTLDGGDAGSTTPFFACASATSSQDGGIGPTYYDVKYIEEIDPACAPGIYVPVMTCGWDGGLYGPTLLVGAFYTLPDGGTASRVANQVEAGPTPNLSQSVPGGFCPNIVLQMLDVTSGAAGSLIGPGGTLADGGYTAVVTATTVVNVPAPFQMGGTACF